MRCAPNKHQGLNADNNSATGARVDEARKDPWRDSQGFLPVTLRATNNRRGRGQQKPRSLIGGWATGKGTAAASLHHSAAAGVPQALTSTFAILTHPHTSLTPSAHPGPPA